jgi:hypothetical protein
MVGGAIVVGTGGRSVGSVTIPNRVRCSFERTERLARFVPGVKRRRLNQNPPSSEVHERKPVPCVALGLPALCLKSRDEIRQRPSRADARIDPLYFDHLPVDGEGDYEASIVLIDEPGIAVMLHAEYVPLIACAEKFTQ